MTMQSALSIAWPTSQADKVRRAEPEVLRERSGLLLLAMVVAASSLGCMTTAHNSVTVRQLPDELLGPSRTAECPVPLQYLQRTRAAEHLVGPGDVIGIFIPKVTDALDSPAPAVYVATDPKVALPAMGQPYTINSKGEIELPLIAPINVTGMTVSQLSVAVRRAYIEKSILAENTAKVYAKLTRPRTIRVAVVREDTQTAQVVTRAPAVGEVFRHGSAQVVDLSAYENDVLHALTASGGLPASDGKNEVWVLRGNTLGNRDMQQVVNGYSPGAGPDTIFEGVSSPPIRIPLRYCPNDGLSFTEADITLQDGDIVFIGPREEDFFLTGGLLPSGKFVLPRDRDIDVLEAMALAGGTLAGPPGGPVAASQNFRSGPGNVVPPSRMLVVRRVRGGGQVKISVNLRKAMDDPQERLIILPGDLLLLEYTPGEMTSNIALNIINFSFIIPNGN